MLLGRYAHLDKYAGRVRDYKREYERDHASPAAKRHRAMRNKWNRRLKGVVPQGYEIDHVRQLRHGGGNGLDNIRLLPVSQNRAEHNRPLTKQASGIPYNTRQRVEVDRDKVRDHLIRTRKYAGSLLGVGLGGLAGKPFGGEGVGLGIWAGAGLGYLAGRAYKPDDAQIDAFIRENNLDNRREYDISAIEKSMKYGTPDRERMRKRFAKTAAAPRGKKAVIIKGNPYYLEQGPDTAGYAAYYKAIEDELRSAGYADVVYDRGDPMTTPPSADLWVGHSRGASRLRFAPKDTKTINITEYEDGINEYKTRLLEDMNKRGYSSMEDFPVEERPRPGKEHYTLTARGRAALRKHAAVAIKRDPAKWEAAKREAKAKMGGKHSARAMQLAVQIYKKKGGEYAGKKPAPSSNKLRTWTKQKWQWSGGDRDGQGGEGVYLPKRSASALKSTKQGRARLARAVREKREATARGQQFSQHGLHVGKKRSEVR